jgi:DNA integrity scanning protein DisA with diadenylate cyclase activity
VERVIAANQDITREDLLLKYAFKINESFKNNFDDLNVKLNPAIETLLRFTVNLRNITSHRTSQEFRNFVMLSEDIKIEECVVSEKMIMKIIKWFLANKGFDISEIPNYTYILNNETTTKNITIPTLFRDEKSFKDTQLPQGYELHIYSMITDYLIRGFSLKDISNKYFNEYNDEGKISFKILMGIIGLNTKWQELFKNNNYKDLVNLLDFNEHKEIIAALKLHIKKNS